MSTELNNTEITKLLSYILLKSDKIIDLACDTIRQNDIEMFNTFMKLDLDVNQPDTEHQSTMIMHAAQQGRPEMLAILLNKGARVDMSFKSALRFAIVKLEEHGIYFNENHIECIKLLLKANANI